MEMWHSDFSDCDCWSNTSVLTLSRSHSDLLHGTAIIQRICPNISPGAGGRRGGVSCCSNLSKAQASFSRQHFPSEADKTLSGRLGLCEGLKSLARKSALEHLIKHISWTKLFCLCVYKTSALDFRIIPRVQKFSSSCPTTLWRFVSNYPLCKHKPHCS